MQIIAHRGFIHGPDKGGVAQLISALRMGFGVEFDVRDEASGLVLAHDPWQQSTDLFHAFLSQIPSEAMLAINIKSCGLSARIKSELATNRINLSRCFFFDMAVPDHLHYLKIGLPTYSRLSEFEPMSQLVTDSAGVWLDSFQAQWWDGNLIADLLFSGKSVCVVSPELHGRSQTLLWNHIKEKEFHRHEKFMLCTDFAIKAREFFV